MKAQKLNQDVYYKKTVIFNAWKQSLQLKISQELFSSHDIDLGTKFLLRSIVEADYKGLQKILDLGCGYGPIGLMLKKLNHDSSVHLVDRDALAVEYSRQNAIINGLKGVEVYGSLGYDDARQTDFDLIASNIPGKAGEPVLKYLLQEARYYLAPRGTVAIVVVEPLKTTVSRFLEETPHIEFILKRDRPGHAVFHYCLANQSGMRKPEKSALERGAYHRNNVEIHCQDLKFSMQAAYSLPEFNSLSYGSEMLIKALQNIARRHFPGAAVYNPGQGHVAVALWKLIRPENILLADRDLLALRYSKVNLVQNECPPERIRTFHQIGAELESREKIDLFTIVLREEEGREAIDLTVEQAAKSLSENGLMIISAGSTAITRLAIHLQNHETLRIRSRERWRGNSLLLLERG